MFAKRGRRSPNVASWRSTNPQTNHNFMQERMRAFRKQKNDELMAQSQFGMDIMANRNML